MNTLNNSLHTVDTTETNTPKLSTLSLNIQQAMQEETDAILGLHDNHEGLATELSLAKLFNLSKEQIQKLKDDYKAFPSMSLHGENGVMEQMNTHFYNSNRGHNSASVIEANDEFYSQAA